MLIDALIVDRGKDDYSIAPFVQLIVLQHCRNDRDQVLIGPQLMTDVEVDQFVNGFAADLERFRQVAKAAMKNRDASVKGSSGATTIGDC